MRRKTTSGLSYIVHHGIKGQKWGVRRYQNPDGTLTPEGRLRYGSGPNDYGPIEDTVMKKGTRLRSVSAKHLLGQRYLKKAKRIYTYNAENDWDNAVYKGPFSKFLRYTTGKSFIKEFEFEVIRDLKMPTRADRISAFKSLYKDKRFNESVIEELNGYSILMKHNYIELVHKPSTKSYITNPKTSSDWEALYEIFNHVLERADSYPATREYIRRMSRDYDAMVDDNNQGIYNGANDPVIILRTDALIAKNGGLPIRLLGGGAINENTRKVQKELQKRGEPVKL